MPQKSVSFIFILFHCTFNSFPVTDYDCSVAVAKFQETIFVESAVQIIIKTLGEY